MKIVFDYKPASTKEIDISIDKMICILLNKNYSYEKLFDINSNEYIIQVNLFPDEEKNVKVELIEDYKPMPIIEYNLEVKTKRDAQKAEECMYRIFKIFNKVSDIMNNKAIMARYQNDNYFYISDRLRFKKSLDTMYDFIGQRDEVIYKIIEKLKKDIPE